MCAFSLPLYPVEGDGVPHAGTHIFLTTVGKNSMMAPFCQVLTSPSGAVGESKNWYEKEKTVVSGKKGVYSFPP